MIINLTQHAASSEQIAEGVFDAPQAREEIVANLTFNSLPDATEIRRRAKILANIAKASGASAAMIGGAPWLMGPLEAALKAAGIQALYAFSKRESVEETLPTGEVVKRSTFRHAGFVHAEHEKEGNGAR